MLIYATPIFCSLIISTSCRLLLCNNSLHANTPRFGLSFFLLGYSRLRLLFIVKQKRNAGRITATCEHIWRDQSTCLCSHVGIDWDGKSLELNRRLGFAKQRWGQKLLRVIPQRVKLHLRIRLRLLLELCSLLLCNNGLHANTPRFGLSFFLLGYSRLRLLFIVKQKRNAGRITATCEHIWRDQSTCLCSHVGIDWDGKSLELNRRLGFAKQRWGQKLLRVIPQRVKLHLGLRLIITVITTIITTIIIALIIALIIRLIL